MIIWALKPWIIGQLNKDTEPFYLFFLLNQLRRLQIETLMYQAV